MQPSPLTRASLVGRLHDSQDHEAWNEFVAIYEPLILRLVARVGVRDADMHDVGQQVLTAVARDVEQWRTDGRNASFRRWLFQVARNRAVKFLVAERRRLRARGGTSAQLAVQSLADDGVPVTELFDREYRRQLLCWAAAQVRHEFQETTWNAFWRTSIEDRPVAEVAADLGVSPGTVYVARSRIIARLRDKVQRIEEQTV